ncbi:hypothetical protein LCGC14_2832730 [marine sediment metagenome]|uniref:Uncharacterized protein n=1 Tax=marine sediment metagenome TaxID=412755 RepID=A0A0F8Z0D2_9ZZZZ
MRRGSTWFYGETKVKKNRIITHIIIIKNDKTLEIEVSGESEEQITAYLAEIGNLIRNELIERNVINRDSNFINMTSSVLLGTCPYCGDSILKEKSEKYLSGRSIKCRYCDIEITNKDIKKFKNQL